jgi:hypothetical protein
MMKEVAGLPDADEGSGGEEWKVFGYLLDTAETRHALSLQYNEINYESCQCLSDLTAF